MSNSYLHTISRTDIFNGSLIDFDLPKLSLFIAVKKTIYKAYTSFMKDL